MKVIVADGGEVSAADLELIVQDFAGTHNAAKNIHGNAVLEEKAGNRRHPLSRIGKQNDFFAVFMKTV